SEDAAEGAGTTLDAISRSDGEAVRKLLSYARTNAGLLKEAAIGLVERDPVILEQLSPQITGGIAARLGES
ncbi:MAG TPA: hypothetical protein VJP85_01485, partial [Candidatus Baltobacteraceae bacterium]|nr:hypothetical protein [Candidatus Baltobacteraceae bacterium]